MDEGVMSDEDDEYLSIGINLDHQKIHREKIRFLREPDTKIRLAVLENAKKELICFLNEICWNLLREYFCMGRNEKKLVQNFYESIRYLADQYVGWREKKDFLIQNFEDPFLSVFLNDLAISHCFCK